MFIAQRMGARMALRRWTVAGCTVLVLVSGLGAGPVQAVAERPHPALLNAANLTAPDTAAATLRTSKQTSWPWQDLTGQPSLTPDSTRQTLIASRSRPRCGSKTTCAEMSSCDEAMYFLNTCGQRRLDRDGDGIPCESGPC